ncbi:MAG: nitrite reductase small subunit NirD [Pseudomonadota bacterium]
MQHEPPQPSGAAALSWVDVCALDDLIPSCGVPALIAGRQIAVVRWGEGADVFALSNYDPFSEAFVIARGIVGDRAGCPKIASPIYKQSFDLETGVCLDDPTVALRTYPVRVRNGRVEVGLEVAPSK